MNKKEHIEDSWLEPVFIVCMRKRAIRVLWSWPDQSIVSIVMDGGSVYVLTTGSGWGETRGVNLGVTMGETRGEDFGEHFGEPFGDRRFATGLLPVSLDAML